MRKIKFISLIVVLVSIFTTTSTASAQLRFGLKAGATFNKMRFNEDLFSSDNKTGFTGGAMLEFTVPVVGIGVDASVMYVRRSVQFNELQSVADLANIDTSRDYIDIPVNLKWKISIPVVEKILKPYLATGPSFAILVSKKDVENLIKNKTCDVSWNFGVGAELFSHLQVGVTYGLGISKSLTVGNLVDNQALIEGRSNYWTLTAAYLF